MTHTNLYTKDHLLKNKIIYYQYKHGYRTGVEPIILASKIRNGANRILDIGCGCGPISLILAYRNKHSYIYGWDKNAEFLLLANKSKLDNKFNNLLFENINITDHNKTYLNFFDAIVTNPPFFLKNSVIQSKNRLLQEARYTTINELNRWFKNMIDYLKNDGKAFVINRYDNMKLLISILKYYDVNVQIQPIKSYADSDPKNLIMEINKSDKFSSMVIQDLIVHDRTSDDGYSKHMKEWMR